jgi:hypothetical protein
MRTGIKVVIGVFAVIGVAYVAMAVLASLGLLGTRCRGTIAMVIPSPSRSMFARVESETCGDGPPETIVALSADPDNHVGTRSWQFFRASAPGNSSGQYAPVQVHLAWSSERDLVVSYPKGTRANASAGTYAGVNVTFREVDFDRR